jgi:hypothetical protein
LEYFSFKYVFVKEGIFYFTRRIPVDLRNHYSSEKIAYSLRTKSRSVAVARAINAACKLDEYWYHLRSQDSEQPGKHLLRHGLVRLNSGSPVTTDALKLSEAVVTYQRLKGKGKAPTFLRAAERACGYVIDICGDKPLVTRRLHLCAKEERCDENRNAI